MATAGVIPDQKLEKQIQKQRGCMTGFLQLFDRHHILTGKRLCSSTKRLPSTTSSSVDSSPQSEKSSIESPGFSKELQQSQPEMKISTPELHSPAPEFSVPVEIQVKMISSSPSPSPSPLPAFDPKESLRTPWKLREGPRLSLDSRATFDTKGSLYPKEIKSNAAIFSSANRCESLESNNENNQKRGGGSPSVIARLMGLEGLPNCSGREPIKKVELTRSASESRVSRDFQYRFIEPKHSEFSNLISNDNVVVTEDYRSKLLRTTTDSVGKPKPEQQKVLNPNGFYTGLPWDSNHNNNSNQNHQHQMQQRKMFYDAQDFFPEPKQNGTTLYGEIEKRLKMRGIDEPEKDLETLKQILEALQFKGLLHSSSNRKQPVERIGNRNFVFDRRFSSTEESPIVIMKPSRSSSSQFNNRNGRTGQESTSSPTSNIRSRANGINRNLNVSTDSGRTRMNRQENEPHQRNSNGINNRRGKNSMSSSPDRNESPSSLARRNPLSNETPRKGNNHNEDQNRRSSPINSPRVSPRRGSASDQFTSRSPRNIRKSDSSPRKRIFVRVMDDDSSAFSESSISTSSQFDFSERSKMGEYKEGRTLLERCDKLLHSIAEITSKETELQPSPVSVLDSSFYKDESSPSPIMRRARCIDFKDQSVDLEEDTWSSPMISPIRMKLDENIQSDDSDFVYISEILRVSYCLSEDTDVFLVLEKQKYQTSSQVSRVHRKLVFDTITEILDRKRQLLPWKIMSSAGKPSFRQIWMEFRRIREKETAEDLFEIICGALKKDMVGDSIQGGWVDCPVETSEAVLDIERLIFKDLIADVINDLADSSSNNLLVPALRRTLVF